MQQLLRAALEPGARCDVALAEQAVAEKIAPLLGGRCLDGALDAEPAARERLVAAHQACLAQQRVCERALAEVARALAARGVPVLLLKGAALARLIYGPGRRSMLDVDVLVPAAGWSAALAAMVGLGAQAGAHPGRALTMRLYHELDFRLSSGAQVDVHRALTAWPLFSIDHAGLFERAEVQHDGVLVPTVEDLLVSLAVHAAGDGFSVPLRAVVDGLALAERARAQLVAERAREWRARRATAAWLFALCAHGLDASWRAVAGALDGGSAARALARLVPGRLPRRGARWHLRWRTARAADGALRPLAFYSYRSLLYVGDWVMRRWG